MRLPPQLSTRLTPALHPRRATQSEKITMAATILNLDVLTIQPLIALIIGILILLVPRFLNLLVAIYLILIGLSGLWPHLFAR
jgi:Protein of unknown function (DUF3096)